MSNHPVRLMSRTLCRPPVHGAYIAGASSFIALTVGAVDLLQGAAWPAVLILVGLTFATSAAPILVLFDREGA